ncbi:hypothetical protein N7504_007021 [Penicillium tannophilum]|nr:hypothetical protein N7504_007021 [Penicillium tannophilum]
MSADMTRYYRVKAKSPDAPLKWNDPTEALQEFLRLLSKNNPYQDQPRRSRRNQRSELAIVFLRQIELMKSGNSGGPLVLLAEIRLEHTKRFLGSKAINTFLFPKIIDDPSLIFSLYVFIFGILFWLQAFKSLALFSIERLRSLFIQGGHQ